MKFKKISIAILLTLSLSGCLSSPVYTNYSREDGLISYAEAAIKSQNWFEAFYFLEENINSNKPDIQSKTQTLFQQYPLVISDYSESAWSSCLKYGNQKCISLMNKRFIEYKKVENNLDFTKIESEFHKKIKNIAGNNSLNNDHADVNKNTIISDKLFENKDDFGFKSYILGTSQLEITNSNWFCKKTDNSISDTACFVSESNVNETIAGAKIKSISLYFQKNQLTSIYIKSNSSDYRQIALALVKKYGKGDVKNEIISNRMGAKFNSEEIKWSIGDFRLSIEERSGKIDECAITYSHKKNIELMNKKIEKQSIDNSKDL